MKNTSEIYKSKGGDCRITEIVDSVWRIPDKCSTIRNNKLCNKYLKHQYNRFHRFAKNREIKRALGIIMILMQRSKSYRVFGFNRILRGSYYSMPVNQVKVIGNKLDQIIGKGSGNLVSSRVYIPKPNGKLRPLGVPTPEGRIYIAMGTDALYHVLEPNLKDGQHGFRKRKSTYTVWKQIGETLEKNDFKVRIFEFDFTSYFNTCNIRQIETVLINNGIPREVANMITGVNSSFPYSKEFVNEDPEVESPKEAGLAVLRRFGTNKVMNKKPKMTKYGAPQGLPGSPLLCSLLFEQCIQIPKNHGPNMYADDGIIIVGDSDINPTSYLGDLGFKLVTNIQLSFKIKNVMGTYSKATGFVKDVFKFVGLIYNYKLDQVFINERFVDRKVVSEEQLKKLVSQTYSGDSKSLETTGSWDVDDKSYMCQLSPYLTFMKQISLGGIYIRGFFKYKLGSNIYRHKGFCFPYMQVSSDYCVGLTDLDMKSRKGCNVALYLKYSHENSIQYRNFMYDSDYRGTGFLRYRNQEIFQRKQLIDSLGSGKKVGLGVA